jgi:hypothetical protein
MIHLSHILLWLSAVLGTSEALLTMVFNYIAPLLQISLLTLILIGLIVLTLATPPLRMVCSSGTT